MNSIIDNQKEKTLLCISIGVIIPTRLDRPGFFGNCLRMLEAQTLKYDYISVQDYTPESTEKDITQRYRRGYDELSKKNVDIIVLWEDDDYYSPGYLETMVREWDAYGRPDIFGTNYTIYYHLKLKKYFTMHHHDRASAMNTLIKPNLKIKWPSDNDPYTDIALWMQLKGVTFRPSKVISIGIKHNIGLTGGRNHNDRLHRYKFDNDGFIESVMDIESLEFYSNAPI